MVNHSIIHLLFRGELLLVTHDGYSSLIAGLATFSVKNSVVHTKLLHAVEITSISYWLLSQKNVGYNL